MRMMNNDYHAFVEKRNLLAPQCAKFVRRNRYYHEQMLRYYRFLIPEGSSVLQLGCSTGHLIGNLACGYGLGVDVSPEMVRIARENHPETNFNCEDFQDLSSNEKFDYIIVSGILGWVSDVQGLLERIKQNATSDTRIIIDHYNPLWHPVVRAGEAVGLKMPEDITNWLSMEDIENFLYVCGYQVISQKFHMIFPKGIPAFSWFMNKILGNLPILRRFGITHTVVARLNRQPADQESRTCSVVITCRDEEGNIEGLVKRIPEMGTHTEIIFVEGHSQDNTIGKIKEMQIRFPEKDIKLFKQKGIGQGDAFRLGYDLAKGDFVIWLEADLTTPPEEAVYFWNAYINGYGEYINGSRFIYKMEKHAMPLFNFLGNRFFGMLFTILLKQRFTDALCGFKGISKKNYMKIRRNIEYFGDFDPFGDFELIFGAIKNSLKVAEIPVHYRPRDYGEPKAYGKSFFSFLKHGWLLVRMSWIAFMKFVIG